MRILSRYFVFGYLRFYAGIIAVSMLVIAIIEMMVNFDDVIDYGEGIQAGLASYLFLRLPSYYLPFLIPVASFGAAFLCLGLPARSLEILATKASGISPRRLAAPDPRPRRCSCSPAVALWLNETLVRDTARRFDAAEPRRQRASSSSHVGPSGTSAGTTSSAWSPPTARPASCAA